jgi:hypothetical protein
VAIARFSRLFDLSPLLTIPQRVLGKVFFGMCALVGFCDRVFILLISSAIIEDIKNMRKATPTSMAYYYFDYKDASKRDIRGLLASLLFQLGDNSDRCWDALYGLFKTCRDGSEQPSEVALANCFKSMLELPGQFPIFIIMDALDECPGTGLPSAREEVLDLVEDLVDSNYPNLL